MNDITFVRTLQSVLYDNKYDRFVANRRTGKLNHKSLKKISFSDKLFKRKESREHKDYSIAILVDCSGSMTDGGKMRVASDAAQKLSKHMSSAKINHAVYGFHAITSVIKGFNDKYGRDIESNLMSHHNYNYGTWGSEEIKLDDGSLVNKYRGPYITYYPKYKESSTSGRYHQGSGDNNDPDAIRYVAKQLSKEQGMKILIVLSDGSPALSDPALQSAEFPKEHYRTHSDLKKVVSEIIHSGIEVHSIGILDDSVNKYYPASRTCSIYNLNQLYDHIIKIIKLNLKRT